MLNFCPWSPEPHASCWLRYRPPCTTIIYRPPTVQCWNVLLAGFYIYYHFADILGTGHCVWGPLSDLGDAHFGLAVAAWPFYHSPLHLCLPMFCEYGVETIFKQNKWRLYQLTCLVFPFFFLQWLPESARYDVLTGNQEKALATLKRIATENGAPMPLGKLIAARQVRACFCRTQTPWTLFMNLNVLCCIFRFIFSLFFSLGGSWEDSRLIFITLSLDHSSAVVYLVR